ncbi:hypothetical protein EV126DRAFT_428856 [Verticillium dahliae]|nr:hypothetical protein EV126DRAFT_428856 [Verticillium dahliae]
MRKSQRIDETGIVVISACVNMLRLILYLGFQVSGLFSGNIFRYLCGGALHHLSFVAAYMILKP